MDDKPPLRILLADDDEMITSLLSMMLTEMGYHVCAVAGSEADAVAAARSSKPDLMIVDAKLGNGSGVAAVDTILRDNRIAYILTSGGPIENHRPGAILLPKPFYETDLKTAIARAIP